MQSLICRAQPQADSLQTCFPPISVIGLDTTTVPAYLLGSSAEERRPLPIDTLKFSTLNEFSKHWDKKLAARCLHIAVPAHGPDPLGIQTWLRARGERLEKYDLTTYRHHINYDCGFQNLGLPDDFARAYALAMYALYRCHIPRIALDALAKVFEAHYLLQDLRHEMHRLSIAFPVLPPPPDPEDLPF